jgi:replicative DNA helicase
MDLTNLNKDKKGRKPSIDLSTMVYGKVPPQSKELEEDVLGIIMMEPHTIDRVVEFLSEEKFYVGAHQLIFKAIMSLHQKGQPADTRMVVEELKRADDLENVGGPYYVTKLTKRVVSSANIENYSRIILQKFIQRELIRIGGEIIFSAYENSADAFELLDKAEEQFLSIGQKHIHSEIKGIDSVLVKAIQRIEEWRQLNTHVTGVPSGYDQLDRATRGWQNGDLIILAARPSIGKTSLALRLARNAAKVVPVAIWSLEMEDVQLVLRMLSAESGLMLHRIQTGRLEDVDMKRLYQNGIQTLAGTKIFIEDEAGLTLLKLRAKARRLKKKHDIGLILIDYLQLMTGDDTKGNREQEVSKISRGLKLLAKELKIPVVALSQINRAVENRTGAKRVPQLSDLRESGAIEQDADVVAFLWGPEDEEIEQDASLRNRRYMRIAKARNGMLITIDFEMNKDTQEWDELAVENKFKPMSEAIRDAPRLPYADKDAPFE